MCFFRSVIGIVMSFKPSWLVVLLIWELDRIFLKYLGFGSILLGDTLLMGSTVAEFLPSMLLSWDSFSWKNECLKTSLILILFAGFIYNICSSRSSPSSEPRLTKSPISFLDLFGSIPIFLRALIPSRQLYCGQPRPSKIKWSCSISVAPLKIYNPL